MPVKKSPKKISLNRETLHQLESFQVEQAAGGAATVIQKTCISCTPPELPLLEPSKGIKP